MKPHSSLWHGGKYSKHPNHMGRHRESQKILQHIPLGSDCFFLQTPRFPERLCLGGPRSTASVSRSWRGSEVGSPERTALGNARAPERTPWPRVPGLSIGDNNEAPFVLICGLNRQVLEIRIIPPCRPYWGGGDGEVCCRWEKPRTKHHHSISEEAGGRSQGDHSLGPGIWGYLT